MIFSIILKSVYEETSLPPPLQLAGHFLPAGKRVDFPITV